MDFRVYIEIDSRNTCITFRLMRFLIKLFLTGLALSALASHCQAADIRSTKHNLTGEKDITKLDERQVCSFCHTPVIAVGESVALPQEKMPHWQRSISPGHSFTIYDDIGRLGLGKPSVGSQSIACLSCHDAMQAFGIGKISENHPFGVPYRGSQLGKSGSTFNVQPLLKGELDDEQKYTRAAEHLKSLEDFHPVSQGRIENRTIWWVSSSGVSSRRTRSDLPLYSRSSEALGSEVPHIECSSCHDPHSSNQLFLRVSNEGSKLCLTCHDK